MWDSNSMEEVRHVIVTEWKDIIKRGAYALSMPALNILYYLLNQNRGKASIIEIFVDKWIPFNKYFIVPYIMWYGYVGFFLMYLCIIDSEKYFKLLISLDIGVIICYIIFYFFPTTVPRPQLQGNDIFTLLVRMIYHKDNPYNCFPSIHVLNTLLVAMYVNKEAEFSKKTKIISCILAIFIILSTMFIKQHFFMDVVAATILAYGLYFAVYTVEVFWIDKKNKA